VPSNCEERAADKSSVNIRYRSPYIYLSGQFDKHQINSIKAIPKVYWNSRYSNWVIPATLINLNTLANDLQFIDSNTAITWSQQIANIENPPKCMLYTSPQYPYKVLIQLSGNGVDVDFLKHIPNRIYNNIYQYWVVDHDKTLVKRITDHYIALNTQLVNRIQLTAPISRKPTYADQKNYLLKKCPIVFNEVSEAYIDALVRERYSQNTVRDYYGKFLRYCQSIMPKEASKVTDKEVNEYLAQIASQSIADSTLTNIISAIKFYYEKVIYLPEFKIEKIKRPRKGLILPKVISVEQVDRLLRAMENRKHTTILYALYGHGIRLKELLNLKLADILWDRKQIFIKGGKGKKDRYVNLSEEFKQVMAMYVHEYMPKYYVFEGQDKESQYSDRSVQQIVKNAAKKANVPIRVTPHTLRHCYATHLVDVGTQLPYIKELLGHADIKTTMIYTHITTSSLEKVISPLDLLRKKMENNLEKPQ
jgi:integrase/recombinase XerD